VDASIAVECPKYPDPLAATKLSRRFKRQRSKLYLATIDLEVLVFDFCDMRIGGERVSESVILVSGYGPRKVARFETSTSCSLTLEVTRRWQSGQNRRWEGSIPTIHFSRWSLAALRRSNDLKNPVVPFLQYVKWDR
jgi:hypothetical protein